MVWRMTMFIALKSIKASLDEPLDNFYQEFVVQGAQFRQAKHDFLKRVTEYYEIIREPKVDIQEKDFYDRAQEEKIELEESYRESVRQTNERKNK